MIMLNTRSASAKKGRVIIDNGINIKKILKFLMDLNFS